MSTHIVILDCGAGNLHSVRKAFSRQIPADARLSVTTDAAALHEATHIVLPGVGAFADCMNGLNALPGMRAALETRVLAEKTPFLGICVGMQMLFQRGHEYGVHEGLGWLQGEVRVIAPNNPDLRIPHMGWNRLRLTQPHHPALHGIRDTDFVYFVHSYAASAVAADDVAANVDYGGPVVAMVARDHIVGTQFHPEKSQTVGLRLISNFIAMYPYDSSAGIQPHPQDAG